MPENPEQITYFAETNSRGKPLAFGIKRRDRVRHMYVIGKTGMGKSTLLENMAIQDIRNGEGMAFIDPHGSTADRIMEYVPAHRIKDVVYFAPFDMEYPVAFNVMEDVGYDKRHLVVSGLLSAFRKIWVDAWSARMEYILSNTLLALLEYPGATLLDVNRLLINKHFRKKVVDNVQDPIVKSFWVDEFANYTDRYTQDATPAIQNKIGQFTSNPLIRNIVGQPKSSFDIRQIMDDKKILIMNLSKGRVGEVNATLLGSMLVTKIYLAAMSRADVSSVNMQALPNFYFYVDEFQNFANESFSDILSEARKYKLNLIIAHQYVEQMEEEVRDAVFGNVGTTVAFRVGPFDAETLETVFAPQFEATDLVNLGFAQIYLTLMIDGVGSPPFSATTLPPFDTSPEDNTKKVLESSREQFAKPRAEVEKVIEEWQGSDPPAELSKPVHEFNPDGSRRAKPKYGSTTAKPAASAPRATPAPAPTPAPTPAAAVVPVSVATRRHDEASPAPTIVQAVKVEVQAPAAPKPAARPAPARQPAAPKPKAAEPQKPPLEGATSLRDALAAVTKKPAQEADAPKAASPKPGAHAHTTPQHAPDLKEALDKIAPTSPKPAGLPKDVLEEMLKIDEK
ncbi:MAG TPA: type IV secretion system DNA-binding domain-containing protein [Candidatus Paceibacterota bacterium]